MSYALTEYYEHNGMSIQLTEAEAQSIILARDQLLAGLTMEYVFEISQRNYDELEKTLGPVRITEPSEFTEPSWGDSIDALHVISRKLANFLSSVKTYQDRIPSLSAKIVVAPGMKVDVELRFSKEYDAFVGYRFGTCQ